MKIIVTERIADEGINYLIENGHEVDTKFGISHEELLEIIENYDAIIVRSVTRVNEELLLRAKNLKVAGRAGNGIDNIEVPACTKRGIIVVNTPESNIMAAAELTIGLAFSIFRNIPQAHWGGKVQKDFRRNRFIGNELDEKTVGIIGLGRIGSIVATKLKGCNMKVVAYDPYITDEKFKKLGVERCETLEELLEQSDLITIHTPKTAETVGIISEEQIKLCKNGVRIVNAARGGLVNEEDLYNGIKEGKIAAAALDVLNPEPNYDKKPEDQDYTNKLYELDNVIITPHLGASTEEANYNVGTAVAKLVSDALLGEMVAAVNMPPMKNREISEMKPYVNLAEILGKIYYQAERDTVNKIEIIYSGELAEQETKLLSLSVLKGFLDVVVKEKVNYVNAELIAKNMGISLVESKSSQLEKYTNLITVKFITKKKTLAVSGTVFAKEELRVVDFFGYKLDFDPTPYVLAIQNVDQPGIIGQIGSILGASEINIAAMQWSRNRRGEKAVAFVSVDCEVADNVIELLKQIKGVLKVTLLKF
jgi:D-3-phosphoglycerate dehydrogenase